MAECASHVMADNGCADQIKLIRKRSTDVTVGPGHKPFYTFSILQVTL